jgi:hypothetical protein
MDTGQILSILALPFMFLAWLGWIFLVWLGGLLGMIPTPTQTDDEPTTDTPPNQ